MEAKEVLAGYSLLEVVGTDEAVEIRADLAGRGPGMDRDGGQAGHGPVTPPAAQRGAAGEQLAFGRVSGQLERSLVGRASLLMVPKIG
jgi:hypothetical protein